MTQIIRLIPAPLDGRFSEDQPSHPARDNQVVPNQVGLRFIAEHRSYLSGLDNRKLAETLIGGLSTHDFPEAHGG